MAGRGRPPESGEIGAVPENEIHAGGHQGGGEPEKDSGAVSQDGNRTGQKEGGTGIRTQQFITMTITITVKIPVPPKPPAPTGTKTPEEGGRTTAEKIP